MHKSFIQNQALYIALFLVPLLFNIAVWQLSVPELARTTEIGLLFLDLLIRLCLLIKGIILGCVGGLLSVLLAIVALHIFQKSQQFTVNPILYASF